MVHADNAKPQIIIEIADLSFTVIIQFGIHSFHLLVSTGVIMLTSSEIKAVCVCVCVAHTYCGRQKESDFSSIKQQLSLTDDRR